MERAKETAPLATSTTPAVIHIMPTADQVSRKLCETHTREELLTLRAMIAQVLTALDVIEQTHRVNPVFAPESEQEDR